MVEDALLILRFKRGSPEALRQIYDRYKVDLLKFTIALVADVSTAEDLVHDAFVCFARSADRLRLTGNLKNYLVTIVLNRVRNHRRDSQRHAEAERQGAGSSATLATHSPLQWAVLSEQLILLTEALRQLPDEQREVICLRMEMDMTFGQIAALQETSTNTVKGRYRYALAKLRSRLDCEVGLCRPQNA